ncbi:hypothetical protein D4765_17050 [Subtercola vilae]|uniref:Soluble ligand binding domain-containing protein n=1 Tax=Subtercola vilae TaxID=2056433 RepID=A0A4T2BGK5_9MICO|nr:hypothetical protein D4765_17050 [Subtercola vilae]
MCSVLFSIFAPHGRTETVALPTAGGGVSNSARAAGSSSAASTSPSPTPLVIPGTGGTPGTSTTAGASSAPSTPGGAIILVHVVGAVAHAGLYELHRGDRLVDAVAAAGGFSSAANQTTLNLARVINDGEQIVVPEQGAPAGGGGAGVAGAGGGASSSGSGSGGSGSGSGGGVAVPSAPVNLNTADEVALETLPHVGPALAQRILAWRTANGQFTQIEDLKNVSGIGDKTFDTLKPLVTV